MSHINLNLLVKIHPRHLKMRKRRGRRLRPVRPSRANELWYKTQLLGIVKLLRQAARTHLLPAIKHSTFRGDAALPNTLRQQFETMQRQFGGIQNTAQRLSKLAVQKNREAVDERLAASIRSAVGIDVRSVLTNDGIREALVEATRANVELITSIPSEYFDKLEQALMKNFTSGSRWEDLADVIERVGDVTESRAKLIARDQTSKMNGAFNEARQTSIGIERYEWQTAGDERVRETHADNDGKVFDWDDPPEETGNPGEDVNCRCVAVPYFDLDEEEADL